MPVEHGGWAFLAEPIALGIAVAFSWAGVLVALSMIAAFLVRQPLKLAINDRRHHRRYTRTHQAEAALAVLALAGTAALSGAVFLSRGPVLFAIGLGAPLAAIALTFDLTRQSRKIAAELAAPVALGAGA